MKKLVIVLFVFCSVLFVTNPILKSSFANNDSKPSNEVTKAEKPVVEENRNNKTLETNTVSNIDNSDSNKDITAKEVSTSTNNKNSYLESKKEVSNAVDSTKKEVSKSNETNKKDDVVKNNASSNTEANKDQDVVKPDDSNKDVENNKSDEVNKNENTNVAKTLSKDDALNLLLNMNPNLVYAYQGDENTFPVLKDKGLSGYVFLPNVDTDLGYFVDKNTSSIYYFHPSGYLEKIR
ncbi:hypothetical protein RWY47_11665 [Paraclostridium sp. MRS3W1]|uniref:hypothetical protein n=1 Tax=Peptostreptococcaceae TaxID=186804 RepID=UPI00124348D0|nr:hypothetical protein [Paraclostridium sp. MRS3W1]MDU0297505.1 hypothetical protein [Paraclostridium sp. MRS3W1]